MNQKYNTDNGCFTISRGVSRIVSHSPGDWLV